MAVDRRAWEASRLSEGRRRERDQAAALTIARLRQAAVPMERLTGSEPWDTFLRHGEALQEADRAELEVVKLQFASVGWLSPKQLQLLRHRASSLQVALLARQELLDLPRQILESVQKSADLTQ